MRVISKVEVKPILGAYPVFGGNSVDFLIHCMKYMGGIAELDQLVEKGEDVNFMNCNLDQKPNGVLLSVQSGFKKYRVPLLYKSMEFWTIEKQEKIYEKKGKSVVGRALIGGILLGPVGAVVGGMSGIGDKKVRKDEIQNILSVSCSYQDKSHLMLFNVSDKKVKSVRLFFDNLFPGTYKEPDLIEESSISENTSNKASVADELIKLKQLLDAGILTQEEFDTEKSKILGK